MSLGRLLGALLLVLLGAVWTAENATPVRIRLLFWVLPHVDLALVLLLAVFLGAALATAIGLPRRLLLGRAARSPSAGGSPGRRDRTAERQDDGGA